MTHTDLLQILKRLFQEADRAGALGADGWRGSHFTYTQEDRDARARHMQGQLRHITYQLAGECELIQCLHCTGDYGSS